MAELLVRLNRKKSYVKGVIENSDGAEAVFGAERLYGDVKWELV
jgi:hypothetical protein